MITYVNTVLVGTGKGLATKTVDQLAGCATKAAAIEDAGRFVIDAVDGSKVRVGLITNKVTEAYINGNHTYSPVIRWSNVIKKADIKSFNVTNYNEEATAEDTVTIDFTGCSVQPGERVILKLTFKDLPTRLRKWTESYEYVAATGTAADIVAGLKDQIVKNYKRARIDAAVSGNVLTLTALPYDDDEMIDSISWFNKVRFSANVWYTKPEAQGFASKNKYALGCTITKTPGIAQVGDWKLVRDAEAQAMGYAGILNRGECTWPVIKPDMNVKMNQNYDSLTLEFENMYRTADDLQRKTKQTLQIFEEAGKLAAVATAIKTAVGLTADIKPEIKLDADVQPDAE